MKTNVFHSHPPTLLIFESANLKTALNKHCLELQRSHMFHKYEIFSFERHFPYGKFICLSTFFLIMLHLILIRICSTGLKTIPSLFQAYIEIDFFDFFCCVFNFAVAAAVLDLSAHADLFFLVVVVAGNLK